jgi:hypothetical protein
MKNLSRALLTTTVLAAGLSALPAAAHASVPRVSQCSSADLRVDVHSKGAAAGSAYVTLRYRNVSGHACRTGGFGGLSFVGHGNGTQIGDPAARRPGTKVRSFVLRPGQWASSLVQIANAANYPKRACHPTKVDGFRVYVPNSRTSQYVPYATVGCARSLGKLGPQLSHEALHKVR